MEIPEGFSPWKAWKLCCVSLLKAGHSVYLSTMSAWLSECCRRNAEQTHSRRSCLCRGPQSLAAAMAFIWLARFLPLLSRRYCHKLTLTGIAGPLFVHACVFVWFCSILHMWIPFCYRDSCKLFQVYCSCQDFQHWFKITDEMMQWTHTFWTWL